LLAISCGDDYKTPADIKGSVAWLSAESALPVFPFGTNPIYFYFHTDRSPYCQAMKEKIFSRPEIIKYMNEHFTSIIIDPDSLDSITFYGETMTARELLTMLQVEGLPSHYFFNRMGELKGARTGYIQLKEFKQLLKYVAEGYIEKHDFNSYLKSGASDLDTIWGKF
jgi:thioredoxin-related protein